MYIGSCKTLTNKMIISIIIAIITMIIMDRIVRKVITINCTVTAFKVNFLALIKEYKDCLSIYYPSPISTLIHVFQLSKEAFGWKWTEMFPVMNTQAPSSLSYHAATWKPMTGGVFERWRHANQVCLGRWTY